MDTCQECEKMNVVIQKKLVTTTYETEKDGIYTKHTKCSCDCGHTWAYDAPSTSPMKALLKSGFSFAFEDSVHPKYDLENSDTDQYKPLGFGLELYRWQLENLKWMSKIERKVEMFGLGEGLRRKDMNFFNGGLLADNAGLGKSAVLLALALNRANPGRDSRGNTLIVCPYQLIESWTEEIKKCIEHFRVLVISDDWDDWDNRYDDEDMEAQGHEIEPSTFTHSFTDRELKNADIVLVSSEMISRNTARIDHISWYRIVLDEITEYRSNIKKLNELKSTHRWLLSGTPFPFGLHSYIQTIKLLLPPNEKITPETAQYFKDHLMRRNIKKGVVDHEVFERRRNEKLTV